MLTFTVEVVVVEVAIRVHVPHVVVVVRISRAGPDKPSMKPTGTLLVLPYIILLLVNTIYLKLPRLGSVRSRAGLFPILVKCAKMRNAETHRSTISSPALRFHFVRLKTQEL